MSKSVVIQLIEEAYCQDDYGVIRRETEPHKVFAKVSSINASEWFDGGGLGLNPQYRFTMFSHDYHGENLIQYEDKIYTIYRTFNQSVDQIELYTELRKGNESA